MTASKPAAQQLHDILDRGSSQPFEGSGCSDHVSHRNLAVSVLTAALLLLALIAILAV
ncbi:MAG: hypothetical protein Q7T31_04000 [Dietzia sp.]|uniref:hypothetical protein n=1 Tax=Dietzia TaxID=37914 RepID=UPI0015C774CD|nr:MULTISPECIES: hypothetical protein [Dietzia]MBC7268948.1 hypothetical protein [Streptomyces sp.]MBB1035515.1 hypothetical protein [Dietzia sp. CQ4]MBB1037891.1 hypothetical protein [Dietzia natronolimnaea]MBB1041842.1 hypothetical protein [Dietzia sp. Cai40]MBB1045008.1 hypothetical protein [Dietzia sp. DQ11-44]